MLDANKIEEMTQRILDALPGKLTNGVKSVQSDLEKGLRSALLATFSKMELVTREEFDIQREVLVRTRRKLEALEAKVSALEAYTMKPDRLKPDLLKP